MLFSAILCFNAIFVVALVTIVDLTVTPTIGIILWVLIVICSVIWTRFINKFSDLR